MSLQIPNLPKLKTKQLIAMLMLVAGIFFLASPALFQLSIAIDGEFYMERVNTTQYVAYLDAQPNTSYELQYSIQTTNPSWTYAGVFVTDNVGHVATFPLTPPTTTYPMAFRFVNPVNGAVTESITIDFDDPPVIGETIGNDSDSDVPSGDEIIPTSYLFYGVGGGLIIASFYYGWLKKDGGGA